MKTQQVKCDTCGVIKGKANHWFELWVFEDESFCIRDEKVLITYDGSIQLKDFCGQDCLIKEIQRIISK